MISPALRKLLDDILDDSGFFLGGVSRTSPSLDDFLTTIADWGGLLGRKPSDVLAIIEPCLRQSVLMSLLPVKAFDPKYIGSVDAAVAEHVAAIGVSLTNEQIAVLRNICLHVRRLQGMSARDARTASTNIAALRAMPPMYNAINARQKGRCAWCGVDLKDPGVAITLDHVAPKHIGDDMADGSNWSLTCESCNQGKADTFAWSTAREAHDYLGRNEFEGSSRIDLRHRIAVLLRAQRCDHCTGDPSMTELWVYRRVPTGLPIPSNCGAACSDCAQTHHLEVLLPLWVLRERTRHLSESVW